MHLKQHPRPLEPSNLFKPTLLPRLRTIERFVAGQSLCPLLALSLSRLPFMASQRYSSSLFTSDDPPPDGLTLKIPATESYQLRLEQHQLDSSPTVLMDGVGSYSPDLEAFDFPGLTGLPIPTQIAHEQAPQPQAPRQPKPRRRHSSTDAPKHRRTRSGCYTCRQRRVKVSIPRTHIVDQDRD